MDDQLILQCNAPVVGIVVFDVDQTLVRTDIDLSIADALNKRSLVEQWLKEYKAGTISSLHLGEKIGTVLTGLSIKTPVTLELMPGADQVIDKLVSMNIGVFLATLAPVFPLLPYVQKKGLIGVYGTLYHHNGTTFDGALALQATPAGKAWAAEYIAHAFNLDSSRLIAVGDSHTDVPMFNSVGFSIAFNGDATAKRAACRSVDGKRLDILLPDLLEEVSSWNNLTT